MKSNSLVYGILCLVFLVAACEKTALIAPQEEELSGVNHNARLLEGKDSKIISTSLTKEDDGIHNSTKDFLSFVEEGHTNEISSDLCTIDISKANRETQIFTASTP